MLGGLGVIHVGNTGDSGTDEPGELSRDRPLCMVRQVIQSSTPQHHNQLIVSRMVCSRVVQDTPAWPFLAHLSQKMHELMSHEKEFGSYLLEPWMA